VADITLTTSDGAELAAAAGDLYLPLQGDWTSHLTLADTPDSPPTGLVQLAWHGLQLTGTILRSGAAEGQTTLLVAGGRGGLWRQVPAKYYDHQFAVRLPLSELLAAAGEQLSAASTSAVLQGTLPSWPRRRDLAGHLLDDLAEATGALWRVLSDGSVFFGADDFAPSEAVLDTDYTLLHTDPEWLQQELAPLTAAGVPLPGQTFGADQGGGRVGRVHLEDDGERYVARVWYLDPGGGQEDLLVAGLRALVREELRPTAWHPQLSGQVVQQRADGTLDVLLDDRRLPPLTSVRYAVPVPGAQLSVPAGARVALAFAGGDPRYPVAQLYEPGSASRAAARVDDTCSVDLYTLTAPVGLAGATVLVGISPTLIPVTPPVVITKVVLTAGKITSGSPLLKLP